MKHPLGVLENVPVQVGQFLILTDFMVLDIDEDPEVPIFLGRPFLATAGAIIDVIRGTLQLSVGAESIEFQLSNPTRTTLTDDVLGKSVNPLQNLWSEPHIPLAVQDKFGGSCDTEVAEFSSCWKPLPSLVPQATIVGGMEPDKVEPYPWSNCLAQEGTTLSCSPDAFGPLESNIPDLISLNPDLIELKMKNLLKELKINGIGCKRNFNFIKGICTSDFELHPS